LGSTISVDQQSLSVTNTDLSVDQRERLVLANTDQ